MMNQQEQVFREGALAAGLTGDEAHTLQKLCDDRQTHATYPELLAQNQTLARHEGVELATIGRSRDTNRRIEVCAVGDPQPGGVNGYIEGPGHAYELLGATTTAVLKELMVYHPAIFRRLGYDGLLFCDHIDLDGMAMQTWHRRPQTLRSLMYGGYRGGWNDQVAWSYPAPNYYPQAGTDYRARHPETAASLDVLRGYRPRFFGAMHSSTFSSYLITSHNNYTMARQQSLVMQGYGLQFNEDEPETPGMQVLAPGIFSADPQGNYPPSEDVLEPAAGGTNPTRHVRPDGLFLTPEVNTLEASLGPEAANNSTTRLAAIAYRTEHAARALTAVALGLESLQRWTDKNIHRPTVRRLHDAAAYWHGMVGPLLASELQQAKDDERRNEPINQAKFMQLVGTTICNAVIAAGNTHRLARMARDYPTATMLQHAIDQGIKSLEPVRTVPLGDQLAVHSLVTLIGLRHTLD